MAHHTAARHLTEAQIVALDALRNRPTLYEIVLVTKDERKALVAYTARKSASGLRAAVHQRAEAVLAFAGAPPGTRMQPIKGCTVQTHSLVGTGGAFVRFTGRTKRDVIMEGTPLPHVEKEG